MKLNTQGDMLVRCNGASVDMGYNYHQLLPAVLWCSYKQLTKKDLFDAVSHREVDPDAFARTYGGMQLDERLTYARELYAQLPLDDQHFNFGVYTGQFGVFTQGNNTTTHRFFVEDGALHIERHALIGDAGEKFTFLEACEHPLFLSAYLLFLASEPKLVDGVQKSVLDSIAYLRREEPVDLASQYLTFVRNDGHLNIFD